MRRLAGGVAGAFALLAMLLLQPWELRNCDPSDCVAGGYWGDPWFAILSMAFYFTLPLVVVGIIQVAVLGVRSASEPHDLAVRAALGETQGTAVRAAASRGLRDGAMWVGIAYVATGLMHWVLVLASDWPSGTERELWLLRLVIGAFTVLTLVLAHVIDAARPRRTPVERLYEEAEALRPRMWRRRLGGALAVIAAVASGVVVGLALAHELAPSFYVTNAAGIAFAVALVAALALGLAVLIPSARAVVPWWIGNVAQRLHGPAGSIVSARAGAVSRASGRVVLVLGSFGFLLGVAASEDPALSLSPTYVGYRFFYADIDAQEFADRLREIDGVAGVVLPEARETMDQSGNQTIMFAVDPADLTGLDDELAEVLADHPTAVAQYLWSGSAELHLAPNSDAGFHPEGIVPLSECCSSFTSASAGMVADQGLTAFLIYSTDPALNQEVEKAAWAITPYDMAENNGEGSGDTGTRATYWPGMAIQFAVLAVFLGTPMVALAIGVVRARRSDDATLAALGSSSRAIRAAIVIETAAVSAFAMAVGLALGAVTHAGATALQRSRTSLTGVITDSYLATALGSVAWTALGVMLVVTVATMTTTAWFASRRGAAILPAEQLRAAQAERV